MAMHKKRSGSDPYPSRVQQAPMWIGREDPVVYSEWTPDAPISETTRKAYERDGFLVLKDLFSAQEVSELQRELYRLRAGPTSLAPETLVIEPDGNALRSIFSIHTQNALFRRLACDARLVRLARFLLGEDVYIHQSRLNYKPGFDGKEFYWHSDFETWHVEDGMPRMRALSMSLLLDDNSAHNGPLLLMPGSHKHFVSCVGETPEDHYKKSLRKQEYGVPDRESLTRLAAKGISAGTGEAGTLVLFDCNTMHGSNGNITPMPRANAFMVFNAMSNALVSPFGGMAPRPEFIATRENVDALCEVEGEIKPGGSA